MLYCTTPVACVDLNAAVDEVGRGSSELTPKRDLKGGGGFGLHDSRLLGYPQEHKQHGFDDSLKVVRIRE